MSVFFLINLCFSFFSHTDKIKGKNTHKIEICLWNILQVTGVRGKVVTFRSFSNGTSIFLNKNLVINRSQNYNYDD